MEETTDAAPWMDSFAGCDNPSWQACSLCLRLALLDALKLVQPKAPKTVRLGLKGCLTSKIISVAMPRRRPHRSQPKLQRRPRS